MSRLIDTNILLRYVTQDIQHKAYGTCIRELSEGGTVQLYAFAELSFPSYLDTVRISYVSMLRI